MTFPALEHLKEEMKSTIDNSISKHDIYYIAKDIVLAYEPAEYVEGWIAFKREAIEELEKYGHLLLKNLKKGSMKK